MLASSQALANNTEGKKTANPFEGGKSLKGVRKVLPVKSLDLLACAVHVACKKCRPSFVPPFFYTQHFSPLSDRKYFVYGTGYILFYT
jgi:hypothetical protein